MSYANPQYLPFIFGAIALLAAFYIFTMKRRQVLAERFAEKGLIANIAPSVSQRRRVVKTIIIISAVLACMAALARPQLGFEWEETKLVGLDMLIAMDVSKSMLANDVKPNRLERSKLAIKDMMKKLNGDRVGLIAFAGTAFLQCPLTIDYNGFLLSLDDLNVSTIPRGGTSIASAIKEAINIFKGQGTKYKVLVIITDGEELEGSALKAAKEAADIGIRIYCVGVGTAEGELIPVGTEYGARSYVADRSGNVVKTKLNEELLKEIALTTGGNYVRATQGEFGLVLLYDTSISKLEKRDLETKMRKRYRERFQYFLAAAILLLILEPMISERKRVVA